MPLRIGRDEIGPDIATPFGLSQFLLQALESRDCVRASE